MTDRSARLRRLEIRPLESRRDDSRAANLWGKAGAARWRLAGTVPMVRLIEDLGTRIKQNEIPMSTTKNILRSHPKRKCIVSNRPASSLLPRRSVWPVLRYPLSWLMVAGASFNVGMRKATVAPPPGVSVTQIVPPCDSMASLQNANPRPTEFSCEFTSFDER